jgi:hypothetical protein
MPFSAKVFVPKSLGMDKVKRAVTNALDGAAEGAKVDFETTTATWQHKVDFAIDKHAEDKRVVGTDDEIYGYVNEGTRPHLIVAHGKALAFPGGGFRPKTRVKVIGSNAGSKGGATVFRPKVQHPGTDARKFDEAIAEKWSRQLPIVMQRAIDAET